MLIKSECVTDLPEGIKGWVLKHPTNPRWMSYHQYRDISTARYIYQLHHQIEVEPNQQVNHSCGNSMCLNVLHLYLGSQRQNMRDKKRHGTTNKGRTWVLTQDKIHYKKLSEDKHKEIRKLYEKGGVSQRELASHFEVSQCCINKILKSKTSKLSFLDLLSQTDA